MRPTIPPEGYTYLYGQRVSLLEYYRRRAIPHKLCPHCRCYAPVTAFRRVQGWWVCCFCTPAAP